MSGLAKISGKEAVKAFSKVGWTVNGQVDRNVVRIILNGFNFI